jgi:hypothetical protein
MNDADRCRLLGTYHTPRVRMGQRVQCCVRGTVTLCGLADAPIGLWPVGSRDHSQGRALVVYKDLARAIRRESNLAVYHLWGVTGQTVTT